MSNRETPFGPKNWLFLAIFTGIIVLGFTLMALESGKGFIDAKEFSISLYVSPFLIIGGFAGIIYAILLKPNLPLEPEPVTKRRSASRRRSASGTTASSSKGSATQRSTSAGKGGASGKRSSRR